MFVCMTHSIHVNIVKEAVAAARSLVIPEGHPARRGIQLTWHQWDPIKATNTNITCVSRRYKRRMHTASVAITTSCELAIQISAATARFEIGSPYSKSDILDHWAVCSLFLLRNLVPPHGKFQTGLKLKNEGKRKCACEIKSRSREIHRILIFPLVSAWFHNPSAARIYTKEVLPEKSFTINARWAYRF